MKNFAPVALSLLLPAVQAQQTMWGQCGGIGWTGPTTCVAGAACIAQNEYYSQCLPGAATATTLSTTSKGTSTSTTPTGAVTSSTSTKTSTSTSAGSTVTGSPAGNPFSGYQQYANPYYSSEVHTLAIPSMTGSLAVKASAVADVPSFVWLDTAAKVPSMGTYLANIKAKNQAGANPPIAGIFVVYDLPDRDCAALASNGEYAIADGGVAKYKAYIDSIRAHLLNYPDVRTILVIEPDSLANLITNMDVPKCSGAKAAYLECTDYALKQLNLPNVAMYMDAGHGGWLGWDANIGPAAEMYAKVYKDAGSPAALRGLAINVSNYNAWTIDTCPSYTQGNKNCDEKRYAHALQPLLTAAGWPNAHFIMDSGRNGVQPTKQLAQGDWCNVIGTGFGIRPTSNTGDELLDAFVWIKPGAESDGTSDTSAVRYDAHCGLADALKPAPEAGQWFQAYFEQLLVNANPSF